MGIVKKCLSKCLVIMKLMRKLIWCACKYNFTFSAKHIPGVKNNLADSLSRLWIDKYNII